MPAWLITTILIVIVVAVMVYTKKPVAEGFGPFKDFQSAYGKAQDTYFHDTAGKAIITNPGLNLTDLNAAMRMPDVYLPKSPDRDYRPYFMDDPSSLYTDKDDFCRGANHPRNLPKRGEDDRVGCGWYYVSDLTRPSVGAIGTADNPLFRNRLPPNGEWIWDIDRAAKLEDIKYCKRVKNCDLMDVNGIRGVCGFCDRLGHAVPINSDGSEKYPDDDDSCGQTLALHTGMCARPEVETDVTSDGRNCGTYGSSSSDGTRRLYTKDECDKLGGTLRNGSECVAASGISYSTECAGLNGRPITVANVCTPTPGGTLTRDCLISLASGLGYSKSGAVLRMLTGGLGPNDTDRVVIDQLRSSGVLVPDAILGSGAIDAQSAATMYKRIFDAVASGQTQVVRQGALYLVAGNPDFDVCEIEGTKRGPFPVECIKRAFRSAGCQPAGAKNPTEASAMEYATMTWGQVADKFKDMYNSMKSTDSTKQADAIKNCLGISMYRPPVVTCANPGMEYLYYSWSNADRNGPFAAFMGSQQHEGGFVRIDAGGRIVGASQRTDNVALKIRAFVKTPNNLMGRFDVWTDDGLIIAKDGTDILNAWRDMATTYFGVNASFEANKQSLLEVLWYENGGSAVLDMRNLMDTVKPYVMLPFPKTAPTVAFDFFRGTLNDIHGTLQSVPFNMNFASRGGRNGAKFGVNSFIQIASPFRLKAIKTITMMVWWDGYSVLPTLFGAYFNAVPNGHPMIALTGGNNTDAVAFSYYRSFPTGYTVAKSGGAAPRGRWVHYAVVFTPDYKGANLYVDGVFAGIQRNDRLYGGAPYPDTVMRSIFLGRATLPDIPAAILKNGPENALNATMGWFHMYERYLTRSEIANEMTYWDQKDFNTGAVPGFKRGNVGGIGF